MMYVHTWMDDCANRDDHARTRRHGFARRCLEGCTNKGAALWMPAQYSVQIRGEGRDLPTWLVSSVALWHLSGQPGQNEGIFRRMTNVSRSLQWAPNIGILRATIKGDQPHAIRTLDLITVLEPIGSI